MGNICEPNNNNNNNKKRVCWDSAGILTSLWHARQARCPKETTNIVCDETNFLPPSVLTFDYLCVCSETHRKLHFLFLGFASFIRVFFLDLLSWCRDALSGNLGFVVPRRKKTETLFAYISVNPFVGLLEQRCCTSPRLWDVPGSTKGSERPTAANSSTDQTAGPFTFCYLFFRLFWLLWMEINANMSAEVFLSQGNSVKCRLDIGLLLATYQTLRRAHVQRSKETWLVVEYQPRWCVKLPSDKTGVMTVCFPSYTDARLHTNLSELWDMNET